jgi:hypothetical protein
MKRFLKWTGGILGVLVLAAGLLVAHTIWFKPLKIDWFFERALIEVALDDPEMLSRIGILDGIGIRGHNARLTDRSEAREQKLFAKARRDLGDAAALRSRRLDARRQLSYDMLEGFLELVAAMGTLAAPRLPDEPALRCPERPAEFHGHHPPCRRPQGGGALHRPALPVRRGARPGAGGGAAARGTRHRAADLRGREGARGDARLHGRSAAREHPVHRLGRPPRALVEQGELSEPERAELGARAEAEIRSSVYPVYAG